MPKAKTKEPKYRVLAIKYPSQYIPLCVLTGQQITLGYPLQIGVDWWIQVLCDDQGRVIGPVIPNFRESTFDTLPKLDMRAVNRFHKDVTDFNWQIELANLDELEIGANHVR